MNKRVFIVHGWGGSPKENWFPWLKKELEIKDFEVYGDLTFAKSRDGSFG